MKTDYKVIIIGSGVAGSFAAYELACAGIDVLVLEKEKLPRYKTCGGGIVHRAKEMLDISIDDIAESKFYSAQIIDHENNLSFNVKRDSPIIYMTMRSDLDFLMLNCAVKVGAGYQDSTKVVDLKFDKNNVVVKTEKISYAAEFVIAADGATGRVANSLGLKNYKYKVPAIENEIWVSEETFNKLRKTARFDFGIIPSGYSWVFPKKNHLSVGIAIMRKAKKSLNNLLDNYITVVGIDKKEIIKSEKHGFFIPLHPNISNAVKDRVLFVGDTIGLADPITAEGISYAIGSGQLAARTLVECNFNLKDIRKHYLDKLKPLKKELNAARFLAWFVYASPSIRKFVFKHYGEKIAELLTDVIIGESNYSRLVRNPINYSKLLKLSYFSEKNR
jgi:geranylgeranyl reductase family protein